ncbi:cadmium resistance transporter, partial [Nocardia puris]
MVTTILQAIGLFLVTNIDDIIVLSLFFARGAGTRGTTLAIATGQYLGFGAILAASILVALGVTALLPEHAIAYFGLIPLLLGLLAAWRAWRNHDDDDRVEGKKVAVWTV